MNESFGAGGFSSTQGGGSGVQSELKEGVAPLVIQQIHNASDDVKIYNFNYGIVTFVAIVRHIEHTSTRIIFKLEDHTGEIDAHLWLEEGNTVKCPDLEIGTYIRVNGSVRNNGGTKAIMIFKIEPMPSINELTTHLLEVLNARYKAEEYSNKAKNDYGTDFSISANNQGLSTTNESNSYGLTGKQLIIFQAIKSYGKEEGISTMELKKKFVNISEQELQSITDYMTQEGLIYTSIDSDHFLSTDL